MLLRFPGQVIGGIQGLLQGHGVARDATEAQIKQAYRKLARKYHPDVSKEKDAEARFKEVGEATKCSRAPKKRAAYDQLGQNHRAGEEFRPPPNWDSGFEFSGAGRATRPTAIFFDSCSVLRRDQAAAA